MGKNTPWQTCAWSAKGGVRYNPTRDYLKGTVLGWSDVRQCTMHIDCCTRRLLWLNLACGLSVQAVAPHVS